MYCRKCGAEIPEAQNTCPGCYAPVPRPGLLSRLKDWLFSKLPDEDNGSGARRGRFTTTVVREVQNIRVADPRTGEERVYHSLDDVPPEIRERIEALRADASATGASQTFTFQDASGQTRTYHSVDEMPPDVREIYERIRKEHTHGE
ncbi:MAG: zinc ribbon domain-containing protein [Phycisphaerae bacterium]|nr:zinc ribbon domain-containing protein [Phycisphaerae bacterium]